MTWESHRAAELKFEANLSPVKAQSLSNPAGYPLGVKRKNMECEKAAVLGILLVSRSSFPDPVPP